MATCPMCNAEVEDVEQHKQDMNDEVHTGAAPDTGTPSGDQQPQQ